MTRPVAAGIQKGLHRIGRRMGQLHALRVFRDTTDLAANPDLWGKVTDAMDRSRYLIVVLSPRAAASEWVNKEVAYWLEQRGPDQLLIVLAEGHLHWDEATGRFDPDRSDAALPVLTEPGVLAAEPLYVDVSADAPWDPQAPTFRDKVTDLAAPIHGKPKYELASDDVREQRRFRRLRRAAIIGLAMLTVIAVAAGSDRDRETTRSESPTTEAMHQRNEAEARRLVVRGPVDAGRCPFRRRCARATNNCLRRDDLRKRRMTAHCSMRWSRRSTSSRSSKRRRPCTAWRSAPTASASSPAAATRRCGCGTPTPANRSARR